jgi:hypothetical protein
MEVSGELHATPPYPQGKSPLGTNSVGGWVGPGTGLNDRDSELRPLGCPARSQSLYRLRSPGTQTGNGYAPNTIVGCYHYINLLSRGPCV